MYKSPPEIRIYLTRLCPYCKQACDLLDKKGVHYSTVDVGGNTELWNKMTQRSNRNTVPQIFINDQHIGGYDDMATLDRDGTLDKLLGLS